MLETLRRRAAALKADTLALYLAARHRATPWHAKLLVAVIVAYALSPIDLVPDFVPVLGLLDDLVLLPLGIACAIKLIPSTVLDECRTRSREMLKNGKPASRAAACVIVLLWVGLAAWVASWLHARLAWTG